MSSSQHVYEVRPRKDRRGIDLIGERLPLGVLWFEGPDAIEDAVNYARSFSYSHPAIIRVFDESDTLAVTLELADDLSGAVNISARPPRPCLMSSSKSIAGSKNSKRPSRASKGKSKRSLRGLQKMSGRVELTKPAPQTVAEVAPDLVPHDANGQLSTVRYEAVNVMLLNEFLKERRKNDEQQCKLQEQEAMIAQQQKQIEALTAGLQKVSAQLEVSKSAPQTVLNNQ